MALWDSIKQDPLKYAGGVGAGVAGGLSFGVPGAIIGGLAGLVGGDLLSDVTGLQGKGATPSVTAKPEQTAAFEREKQLREEAIRQARGMGDAAARGAAQQGALAYGGAGMAPAGGGRLAGLRDVGMGAEGAGAHRREERLQGCGLDAGHRRRNQGHPRPLRRQPGV